MCVCFYVPQVHSGASFDSKMRHFQGLDYISV